MSSEEGFLNAQLISAALGVTVDFDPQHEADRRTAFLADLLDATGARALVLAVSGGVDSAVAAALCRRSTHDRDGVAYVAMRLPYGRQLDADDADAVVAATQPDRVLTIDIQPTSDAALDALVQSGLTFESPQQQDFVLGNIKARERMVLQYAIANALNGLVIGTDHAAEAVTGFFTKHGDGGVDAVPLAGLTKRRVRALAAHLALPDSIVHKAPTADLESLRPQRSDEDALGLTYDQIDDFLERRPVSTEVAQQLLERYAATEHKRALPRSPLDAPG